MNSYFMMKLLMNVLRMEYVNMFDHFHDSNNSNDDFFRS